MHDHRPLTATEAARRFVILLGVARLAAGTVEMVRPDLFLRVLGSPHAGNSGAALGFRMKGARDVGLGLLTLVVRGDDRALSLMAASAVVVDTVDGLAVGMDNGASFNRVFSRFGAAGGVAVGLAAGVSWGVLRRV